ncbi:MAG: hypothetical protein E7211_16925 [Clostridium lundense]|nr:hypothetical protein [Clostridium lundense]
MLVGKVKTITPEWLDNVLLGVINGITEVDYWTSGWVPQKNFDRLEVYYQGDQVLSGTFVNCFKDTPHEVYKYYQNKPHSIGLNSITNNLTEFENLLKIPFGVKPAEIGNIIFNVDSISMKKLKEVVSKKSTNAQVDVKQIDINDINVKEIDLKTKGGKRLQSNIVYEEV